MRGINRYKSSQKKAASKVQIVVLLYQEVLLRLSKAEAALETGSRMAHIPHLHHCRQIFMELKGALNPEDAPELCERLGSLYDFALSELIACGRDRDPTHLEKVKEVTEILLSGWRAISGGSQG